MSDAWGGYANGQIPLSAMKKVQNAYFKPDVADAIAGAIAQLATYKINVVINEGYRPLGIPADQNVRSDGNGNPVSKTSTGGSNQWFQYGRMKRGETPTAATPGGSIHGWGKAADISNGSNATVRDVFQKHGFVFDISSESWHAHYVGGSTPTPGSDDQKTVQSALKAKGLYAGAVDGVFGPNSWKGTQTFLHQQGLYGGAIDGVPGPLTYKAFQTYARRGGYVGPIDGVLGANSWAGFAKAIHATVATPAPSPAPASSPAPTPAPATPEQPAVVPVADPVKPAETITVSQPTETPTAISTPVESKVEKPTPVKEKTVSAEVQATQNAEIASLPVTELGAIIPSAKGRKIAYSIYAGASAIVTNIAIGFSALHLGFPDWLTVAIAIIGNLAVPFGALAIANSSSKK